MQRYLESDHNIKTVIRDVLRYCTKKGIPTTEACTRLLVQLTALDVDKNFIVMTKEQCAYAVDDLIDIVIRKLSNELSPSLLTIKMQSYFPPKFLKKDKIVFDHRNNIAKVTEPLMRELMEKDIKEKELLDALYHKLVVAVTLLSGLGNPTHRAILCSSSLALSSIFPVNELPRFLTLGRLDKERQVEELTHVVAGIRIFNYDTHKHVEGIDDLPNILREACFASKESLENEISSTKKSIEMICKVLKECYVEEPSLDNPDDINLRVNDKILSRDLIEFFRDLLIAKRQMDVYLGQLVYEVERCNEEVKLNVEMLRNRLTELQELVKYRTAIPTTYIYPLFIQVSVIWCSLQDQMVLLSAYNNMLQNLRTYFSEFDQKTSFLEQALANIEIAEKKKRELKSQCHYSDNEIKEYFIDPDKIQKCRLVYYDERDSDSSDTPQFFGCCVLRLIEGNGLLVPGDPTIGLLTFGMASYCFATCKSAYKFDKKPEMYLKQLLILVRRMPELITLLDMAGEVHRYVYKKELQLDEDESEVYKVNASTQTLTHPVESYIDPTYSWDVWELKRKAVQLADICKRRTHSTQTRKSHMRMNVGVQTYEPKEKCTQTKRDNKSTMPKPSTFIFGLRGRSDNLAHTAILTRPHDEWLYEPGARILKNNKI